jgi:hypothetical protein
VTLATGYLPCYVNYGFNPRTNWPLNEEPKNLLSGLYAHWMTSVHNKCQIVLEETCKTMGQYYNKGKKTALGYKIRDLCMLNTKNLSLHHLTKKSTMKIVRPFKSTRLCHQWRCVLFHQNHRQYILYFLQSFCDLSGQDHVLLLLAVQKFFPNLMIFLLQNSKWNA